MSEATIYKRLKKEIGNDYGVFGLMGNLQAESGLRANNMQNSYETKLGMTDDSYMKAVDNGTYKNFCTDRVGWGLCQWTSAGRKTGLYNYAKQCNVSIGDESMQVEWLIYELNTSYKSVLLSLKKATSVKEASDVVVTKFERPKNQSNEVLLKRQKYGEELYKKYVKKEGGINMSNSALATYTKLSPNKTSPRNHEIDTVTIHCYVGQVTAEKGCNSKRFTTYNPVAGASCGYVVGFDGSIRLCTQESDRSWCSSNKANDHRAITIEVACETKSPYKVTDKAMNALINLLADICKRNPQLQGGLKWRADKSLIGKVNLQNMTVHRWFKNKACPGQYLYERHGWIADSVNAKLGIKTDYAKYDTVKVSSTNTSNSNSSATVSYKYNSIDYSLVFNPTYYAKANIDVKNAFGNDSKKLFNHFCQNGMKEGRVAIATFNVLAYKSKNVDLQKAFGNDLPAYYRHYIQYGHKEGRVTT